MKTWLTLSLILFVFQAKAQDGGLYPNLLDFNGRVKEVLMYNPASKDKFVSIKYDYIKNERTIQVCYTSQKNGEKIVNQEMTESFEEMKKDERLELVGYLHRLQKKDYTSNAVVKVPFYGRWDNIDRRIVYKDDKGKMREVQYMDSTGKLVERYMYTYPGDDNIFVVTATDAMGTLKYQRTVLTNSNGNITKWMQDNAIDKDEAYTVDLEYEYDNHNNLTSFTSLYSDGVKGWGYVREIKYEE